MGLLGGLGGIALGAMFPAAVGGTIAAAGDAAGLVYQNRQADERSDKANTATALMQKDQQDFNWRSMMEEERYNSNAYATRYQTMVGDLKKAGLNPMLAYSLGAGSGPSVGMASSSAGSGAISSPGGGGNVGSAAINAFNASRIASAQSANLEATTAKTAQETKESEARTRNIDYDSLVKQKMPEVMAAQIAELSTSAEKSKQATEQIRLEMTKVDSEIADIKSRVEKNKSDVRLNNTLMDLNEYRRLLTIAEIHLTNQKERVTALEGNIKEPEASAAKHWSAETAHRSQNLFKTLLPTFMSGK